MRSFLIFLYLLPTFVTCLMASNEEENKYAYLDSLAREAGTDKSSIFHNYTEVYAQYFDKFRNQPIKFLEIGISYGNSVKLWENYFQKAELHFIDNDIASIMYNSQRSKYHFLNQADVSALQAFIKDTGGQFDIIIDDGGHLMEQQMVSFQILFPHLKSKGMYVIEDLHTSYWQDYGGNGSREFPLAGPGTTIDFLKGLVDDLNYTGAVIGLADKKKTPHTLQATLNEYQDKIHTIHFYNSLCIIIKN